MPVLQGGGKALYDVTYGVYEIACNLIAAVRDLKLLNCTDPYPGPTRAKRWERVNTREMSKLIDNR